jgi:phosphohistidine phosphatase
MKLLVIRHGAAMDKDEFASTGKSDDLRPLTAEGEREMKDVAKGLRGEVDKIGLLATSPLVRAQQTATIVAAVYGIGKPEIVDVLVPDTPFEDFEKWCAKHDDEKVIAVVGHEPHLSGLVAWLLTGRDEEIIRLKKAGACMVEFDSAVEQGSGTLNWLLTARQLAQSGK